MRPATPWVLPDRPTTRAELLAAGITDRRLRTRLADSSVIALRHGVYVRGDLVPGDPRARHVQRAQAEVAANPGAAMSHQSAACVWQLPSPAPEPWYEQVPAITLEPGNHESRSRATDHHLGPLPASQVLRDGDGWPVTSPARTAADLVRGLSLPDALVILDAAARVVCASMIGTPRRRDYANPRLAESARDLVLDAAATIRAPRLNAAIAALDPRRESAAESLSAGHFQLAGLPAPTLQAEIRTPHGVFFPDFFWPEAQLVGECDGAVKYGTAQAYVLEKEREQILRDLGYRIVRWLASEIMFHPEVVIARVARALGY